MLENDASDLQEWRFAGESERERERNDRFFFCQAALANGIKHLGKVNMSICWTCDAGGTSTSAGYVSIEIY